MSNIALTRTQLKVAVAAELDGDWDAALAAYESALPHANAEIPTSELLRRIAIVHYKRGDYEIAAELCEVSLSAADGNAEQGARAANSLAITRQALGDVDAAEQLYQRAQHLAEHTGNARLAMMVEQNMATLADIRGQSELALQRFLSALARARTLADRDAAARVLNNVGMVHTRARDWAQAEATLEEALQEAIALNDLDLIGTIQLNRASLFVRTDRFDDARACCDQAFETFSRLESRSGLCETYKTYGMLFRDCGKAHLARAHFTAVIEMSRETNDCLLEAEASTEVALLHLTEAGNAEALRNLNRAHALFTQMKARRELASIDRELDKLEGIYLQVVQAWGESIEAKDRYTAGHCARVADYTCRLARALGYEGRELSWLKMGAFLHDVGKTVVPPEILNKAGKLDDTERTIIETHASVGDDIVATLGFPYDIRPLVRSHHERWDGTGYPDGLAGEEIPRIARILGIADVYDALTTTRSYRPALSQARALEIMTEEAGRTLDAELFEVFRGIITADEAVVSEIAA